MTSSQIFAPFYSWNPILVPIRKAPPTFVVLRCYVSISFTGSKIWIVADWRRQVKGRSKSYVKKEAATAATALVNAKSKEKWWRRQVRKDRYGSLNNHRVTKMECAGLSVSLEPMSGRETELNHWCKRRFCLIKESALRQRYNGICLDSGLRDAAVLCLPQSSRNHHSSLPYSDSTVLPGYSFPSEAIFLTAT